VGHHTEAFVGIDTSKLRNAVAIADSGRGGEAHRLELEEAAQIDTMDDVALRPGHHANQLSEAGRRCGYARRPCRRAKSSGPSS
jgi:hypothetical protein